MSKKLKVSLISTVALLTAALLAIFLIVGVKQAPDIHGHFVFDHETTLEWMIENKHPAVATEEKKQSYIELMELDEVLHDWDEGSLKTVRPDDWIEPFGGTWFRKGLSTYRAKYGFVTTILKIQDNDSYYMHFKGGDRPFRQYYTRK